MGEKKEFNKKYNKLIKELQIKLVHMQDWVIENDKKVVIIFEGRDAAGKGGTIKRITENLNPRSCKVAALAKPSDRERTQWYFQRYVANLPAAGEIVLFDRSWYNRAGVEKVMGFCSDKEYIEFLQTAPDFERMLIGSGIILLKYWFSRSEERRVGKECKRFEGRINDPTKVWKLSPMDVESINRWEDYSKAKDNMMEHTDTDFSPWYIVESDIKKKSRINCISHILSKIPYEDIEHDTVKLPERTPADSYERPSRSRFNYVPEIL